MGPGRRRMLARILSGRSFARCREWESFAGGCAVGVVGHQVGVVPPVLSRLVS